jgi:hypothetical protein
MTMTGNIITVGCWDDQELVLVWEWDVLSLPKESPHQLEVRDDSKLCCNRSMLSDPVDSRGGNRSVLMRPPPPGAPPMNDMSDDSGSEKSGNGLRADPPLRPVLENGDLSKHTCQLRMLFLAQ